MLVERAGSGQIAGLVGHDPEPIEGERFAGWLQSLSPEFLAETFTDPTGANPRSRLESLLGAKEHEMHHRAQLMLIERVLGIVPHLTRQREERIRQRQAAAALGSKAASA